MRGKTSSGGTNKILAQNVLIRSRLHRLQGNFSLVRSTVSEQINLQSARFVYESMNGDATLSMSNMFVQMNASIILPRVPQPKSFKFWIESLILDMKSNIFLSFFKEPEHTLIGGVPGLHSCIQYWDGQRTKIFYCSLRSVCVTSGPAFTQYCFHFISDRGCQTDAKCFCFTWHRFSSYQIGILFIR